jgi:2-polyprenyl-3-methyl-5-hydroxy-6-metoxy-1,4-benzoquinol methylase
MNEGPIIVDQDADRQFRETISGFGWNPDLRFIGGYVDYEWHHGRFLLDNRLLSVRNKRVLDIGCNIGATSIVMAHLGAEVTALDIDRKALDIGRWNARRYGCETSIGFHLVRPGEAYPFADCEFDVVCCNSVLEYVAPSLMDQLTRQIDRVLKPGGVLCVVGTSSRLWPREVHTRSWFINYVPRKWTKEKMRGASPFTLISHFTGYTNLDAQDRSRTFLESKRRMGWTGAKAKSLQVAGAILGPLGFSVGMFLPSISLTLRKP